MTADRIAAIIREKGWNHLPGFRALAADLGISVPTLGQAARILRERGLVRYSQGRRMRVVGAEPPEPSAASDPQSVVPSVERVAAYLYANIETGVYRVGEGLPKVAGLAHRLCVSDRTVTAALRGLEARGAVAKRGKRWYAGRAETGQGRTAVTARPVVVVLQARRYRWRELLRSPRTARFVRTFTDLSQQRSVQLAQCAAEREGEPIEPLLAQGRQGVSDLIRSLDTRYIGTLIAGSSTELNDLGYWVEALGRWSRPVVWFDRYDERAWQRSAASNFVRCYFTEEGGHRCALDHLRALGHSVVGYVNHDQAGGHPRSWQRERGRRLRAYACGLDLVEYPPVATVVRRSRGTGMRDTLAWLEKRSRAIRNAFDYFVDQYDRVAPYLWDMHERPVDRWARLEQVCRFLAMRDRYPSPLTFAMPSEALLYLTPLVGRIMKQHSPTALIVSSDSSVGGVYQWLVAAGYQIPGRVSLLSFDNTEDMQATSIDSVDFGFGDLAYRALRVLLGDAPVKRDRFGHVAARPFVALRGSTGPAPQQ